jgi:tRNA-splicing ligase RtcB
MRTDGLIFADQAMLADIRGDQAPEQVANMATLPGIVGPAMAMPDIHWGYGFPIGGVAATDAATGVISPGGVGYDINCGVRVVRTDLSEAEVRPRLSQLMQRLFADVPSGVGSSGKLSVDPTEMEAVLADGAAWAVGRGLGRPEDLDHCEERGAMAVARSGAVGARAKKRGRDQLGTLGSGNHFLEVQVVEEVYHPNAAEAFGLRPGQVVVAIHSGSRGLGHQICTDYLEVMAGAVKEYGIDLPDRQLACAPLSSPAGQDYLAAMAAAANYAWANRQCLTHWVRQALAKVLQVPEERLGLELVYDVAHNIAKIERHKVGGREAALCVHRKGATRAFGPGHPDLPADYRGVGQPVLVPGDMGRNSYILVGTPAAEAETFGSACHGAGRALSRSASQRQVRADDLQRDLAERGIIALAASRATLAEEAPSAYKDVNQVVAATEAAGIARRVAKLRPLGVIKG